MATQRKVVGARAAGLSLGLNYAYRGEKPKAPKKYSPFSPESLGYDVASLVIPGHPSTPSNEEMMKVLAEDSGDQEASEDATIITGDMVKEWTKDHRDRWKTNGPSYRQWALLEESHERHRARPLECPIVLPVGFFLLNSHMGSGKNMAATFYAALKYAFGWPAISTSATKFGIHIGPSGLYHFGKFCPLGGFIICDEVHTVFHSNTVAANREQAFQDYATAMRKRDLRFFGMSASKRVSPTYKAIVDWLGYIHALPYCPERNGNGWSATWKYTNWYGPRPYDKDDYEVEHGWSNESHADVEQWPEFYDSNLLLEACKLFDSWSEVKALWGDGYSAEKERKDRLRMTGALVGVTDEGGDGHHHIDPAQLLQKDPAYPARRVAMWYGRKAFEEQEKAWNDHQEGNDKFMGTASRHSYQLSISMLQDKFREEEGISFTKRAIEDALLARQVAVSRRGWIDISEIATLYEKFLKVSGQGRPSEEDRNAYYDEDDC